MSTLKKILVVDDDPVVGKSFDRVLSGKGYAVITAANGEEALAKLASERYDAVFTDIKMTGMSGIEVAERIKASRPWLPVVIVTGYGSPDNEARAEAAGARGFLRKPLSPEMIEGSAEKALLGNAVAAEPAAAEAAAVVEGAAVAEAAAAERTGGSHLKDIALFFAAPFVGLAYVLAFPFVGLALLAWMGGKALVKNSAARTIALAVAAPFIALAYVVLGPIIGLGMLAWIGAKALLRR